MRRGMRAAALAALAAGTLGACLTAAPASGEASAGGVSVPVVRAPARPSGPVASAPAPARDAAGATDERLEAVARRLVDPPLAEGGERDAVAADRVAFLREEPGHPLAEAALRLLAGELDDLDDPAACALQIAGLSAEGLSPLAAHRLARLQRAARAAWDPVEDLAAAGDLHPDQLSRFLVLGPLGPVGNPLGHREGWDLLAGLDLGARHASGLPAALARLHADESGRVGWRRLERSPLSPFVRPSSLWSRARGFVVLAAAFDAPGGPAWIEIETTGRDTPYAVSLNQGEPRLVESYGAESSAVARHAVVLREGVNLLALRAALGPSFAIRVLSPDGRPMEGVLSLPPPGREGDPPPAALTGPRGGHGLGREVDAQPPEAVPLDAERFLLALPARGPDSEALLGLLQCLDGRPSEGYERVRLAQQAEATRPGLAALLARLTLESPRLPEAWRRGRARALAETVVAEAAAAGGDARLDMALHVAETLGGEDREEEAIAELLRLGEAHPRQVRSRLALHTVYGKLGMDYHAEEQLGLALALAPRSPELLSRLAREAGSHGRRLHAAELGLLALRSRGARPGDLVQAARAFASLGEAARAEELLREAIARGGERQPLAELAELLARTGRLDEADALWQEDAARAADDARAPLERAAQALRRGDAEAERAHLDEALRREPSHRAARERRHELTGEDPVEALFARHRVDVDAWLAAAAAEPPTRDSVVKLLDHAVVCVFADGAFETLTQDVYLARDLQGCETLGRQRLGGDVLRVATVKPDGTAYEPVVVGGQYVMPQLKPGDRVVTETRQRRPGPSDGVVRPGRWYFASAEQPFRRSSYVLAHPPSLPLRLERHGEGFTHEILDEDGLRVHRFVADESARVLPEPHAPPGDWYLPWVELGMDADAEGIEAMLWLRTLEPTRVTPFVAEAAARATAGLSGDEQRARVLHRFAQEAIDVPGGQGATEALVQREGNATWLLAALLAAADVPFELVWSRGVPPEGDPELPSPFVPAASLDDKLLVLVQPRDGEPAWCEPSVRGLPYGRLLGEASGALALAVPSGRPLTLPELPPAERFGAWRFELELEVSADLSAGARFTGQPAAGLAFLLADQLRDFPVEYRRNWVAGLAQWAVPGMDLERFDLPGLPDDQEPMAVQADGSVGAFLDDDGVLLSCRLPMPALDLAAAIAGGEGQRRLPYLHGDSLVQSFETRLSIDPSLELRGTPPALRRELRGGSYELSFERPSEGLLVLRRRIALPPFTARPEDYAEVSAFCAAVDEAERGRLRFARR